MLLDTPSSQTSLKPLLLLAFGALCVSFAAVFVKLLGGALGPTAIGFWRTTFGAVILFSAVAVSRGSFRLPRPVWYLSILAGFVFFLDLFFWHRSILYCGAGMATILANTQVFWMVFTGYLVFKEKLRPAFYASALAAFAGVALLIGFGSDVAFSLVYIKGIVLGLATGVVYGTYLTTIKKAGHTEGRPGFLTLMAWTSLFTAIFCGLAMLFETDPWLPPDLSSLLLLIALALVAQALGWWVISSSLPHLRASQSGLVLLLQPVLATVWGVWFFAEYLTALQMTGALITLTAIYFGAVSKARQ